MISGHGTEKLLSMGFEILGLVKATFPWIKNLFYCIKYIICSQIKFYATIELSIYKP